MKQLTRALGALLLVSGMASVPALAADGTITLGAIYPIKTLTGEQGRRSSEFAVEEINAAGGVLGKNLRIIVYDDAFKPADGVAATRRLMSEDGVKIMTGGINGAVALAAMQVVEENDGLFLSAVTKHPELTKHPKGFRQNSLAVSDMGDLKTVLDKAANPQRLFVLADNTDFGKTMINTLQGLYGTRMVGSELYDRENTTDFSTLANKVKALNPDAVCLGFVAAEQGAAILRALSEANVPGVRCITPGALIPQVVTAAGGAAEGAISVDNWTADLATDANKKFVEAFRAKFKEEPGKVDFLAYQSINLLAAALAAAGTDSDTGKIAEALAAVSYDGPIGTVTFKDKQLVGGSPVMIQVKDGKIVAVQ